jgi:hypothetical protein
MCLIDLSDPVKPSFNDSERSESRDDPGQRETGLSNFSLFDEQSTSCLNTPLTSWFASIDRRAISPA